MLDKGKVEKNEEKLVTLHNEVSNILRATSKSYEHGDKYYKDYSTFIATLTTTFANLRNFSEIQTGKYTKRQEEVRARIAKNEDLIKNAEKYEREQTEEKVRQTTLLDGHRTRMTEALAKVDAKLLGKLEIKKNQQLADFFDALSHVFYKEENLPDQPAHSFDWAKFKKAHVSNDNLEDFRRRLGQVDLNNLTNEDSETLTRMRDDPWLDNYVKTDKNGTTITGLTEYLVYVNEAIKANNEVKRINEELLRNKVDGPKREELLKADLLQNQFYQEHIDYLKALNTRMLESAKPFTDEDKRTDAMIGDYEQHKQRIRGLVFPDFAKYQAVPKTVYGETI